jgi:hypothetical protein
MSNCTRRGPSGVVAGCSAENHWTSSEARGGRIAQVGRYDDVVAAADDDAGAVVAGLQGDVGPVAWPRPPVDQSAGALRVSVDEAADDVEARARAGAARQPEPDGLPVTGVDALEACRHRHRRV